MDTVYIIQYYYSHQSHSLFTLLPSGKGYRSICCLSTSLQSSFIPKAVRLLNSSSALHCKKKKNVTGHKDFKHYLPHLIYLVPYIQYKLVDINWSLFTRSRTISVRKPPAKSNGGKCNFVCSYHIIDKVTLRKMYLLQNLLQNWCPLV